MYDFNAGTFNYPLSRVEMVDENIPNLTHTALPIKFIKGRYYKNIDSISVAKQYFYEGMSKKINPYLMSSQAELADIYLDQKLIDSAYYYSSKAFNTAPNHNFHRTVYFKTLLAKKDSSELKNAFEKIRRFNNRSHYIDYITTQYDIVGTNNEDLIEIFNEYKSKFKVENDDLTYFFERTLTEGTKTLLLSGEVSLKAEELFKNKQYLDSAVLFEIAASMDNKEYTHYENAAIAYNLSEKYQKAEELFDLVIYESNVDNGKSEFYKGIMLIKLDRKLEGCNYLKKAIDKKYALSSSTDIYYNLCKTN